MVISSRAILSPDVFSRVRSMGSKLDQLREMTVVVADTGDIDAIRTWRPVDCTTNPTLLLKAFALPGLSNVVQEVLQVGARSEGCA